MHLTLSTTKHKIAIFIILTFKKKKHKMLTVCEKMHDRSDSDVHRASVGCKLQCVVDFVELTR